MKFSFRSFPFSPSSFFRWGPHVKSETWGKTSSDERKKYSLKSVRGELVEPYGYVKDKIMIKQINSLTNPLIKHVAQLHNSKYRKERQQYIAEGFRTISTIIQAGGKLITLFTLEELSYDAEQLTPHSKLIIIVSPAVLQKISTTKNPSGLLAVFAIPPRQPLENIGPGIVLAQIADPGNMGTLIRTAAAMDKKTVVCIESVDPWNPKVVQASAGAIQLVSFFCIQWKDLINNKKNIPLCALLSSGGKNPDAIDLHNALIVVGNEGSGIPKEWIAECDEQVTLPMPGNFESLNAAVAGSIALYLAAQ